MSQFQQAMVFFGLGVIALALDGRFAFLRVEFPAGSRRRTAFVLFTSVLGLCVVFPLLSGTESPTDLASVPFALLFLGQAVLIVILLLWWLLADQPPLQYFLSLDRPVWKDFAEGMEVGILAWVIGILTGLVVTGLLSEVAPEFIPVAPPDLLIHLVEMPFWKRVVVVIIAMTVEEAFFRGFLQPRIGLLPSSIIFALGHAGYGSPPMLLSVFALSLVIGTYFRKRGRLLPCVIAHGVLDAVQLLVLLPLLADQLQETGAGSVAAALSSFSY